ncbi:MAG: ABC transporter substrate-binding protein [Cellulosilyticaceae bacterium]
MKNKWFKRLVLLTSMSMVVASVAGCGQGDTKQGDTKQAVETSGSQATKPEDEKPVKVTAMIAQSRNYEGLQKMIQKLKDEENIIIDAQVVPDDQYTTLMKMKVNSGESPDMIDYNIPGIYYELNPEQFFVDLSGESWVKDLVSPENIEYNGKTYGYPFQSVQGVLGFVYNKEIFDSMGITEPTNWDEFLQVCEKIKNEGNGITPIHVPKDTWVPQIYMTANFATALGAEREVEVGKQLESNELKWTDVPEFAEVLDRYLELYSKGYVNNDFTSVNYDNTIEAMGAGKAAMVFCGDFFANSVLEAFPDAKLGMFNVPMVGNSDCIAATTQSIGFVASKDSKNMDTVKRIFELWSTPEYGNLYFEERPGFPALKAIDGGKTPSYLEGIYDQYISTGKTLEEFNTCLTIGSNVMGSHLWLYYIDAPAKGNMTGADILAKFQGDFEKYMKEMQQSGF